MSTLMPDKQLIQLITQKNWQVIDQYLQTLEKRLYRPVDYFAKGMVQFYWHHQPQQGLQAIHQAHNHLPNEILVLIELSECYRQISKFLQSIEFAEQARKVSKTASPQYFASTEQLVKTLISAKQYNQAFQLCHQKLGVSALNDPNLKTFKTTFQHFANLTNPMWWQNLSGKNLTLSRINDQHQSFLRSCRKNNDFQHHYNLFKNDSETALKKDLQLSKLSPVETKKIEWVVEKAGKPIGIAGLVDLDFRNQLAEIQIGFPASKGKTDALEATLLILEFAFNKIGLNKIVSYVYSDNPWGQKNTLHLGFKQEGVLESHVFHTESKQWLDLFVNGMLKENYLKNTQLQKLTTRMHPVND